VKRKSIKNVKKGARDAVRVDAPLMRGRTGDKLGELTEQKRTMFLSSAPQSDRAKQKKKKRTHHPSAGPRPAKRSSSQWIPKPQNHQPQLPKPPSHPLHIPHLLPLSPTSQLQQRSSEKERGRKLEGLRQSSRGRVL
jgi:hypothetical protein